MTDQHEPDQPPADDTASPPERARGARREGRPPVGEGATVPLKRPSPPPSAGESDPEQPASPSPPAPGQPSADDQPGEGSGARPSTADEPTTVMPPATGPGVWPPLPHGDPLLPRDEPLLPRSDPPLPHAELLLPHGGPILPGDEPSLPHGGPLLPGDEPLVSHGESPVARDEATTAPPPAAGPDAWPLEDEPVVVPPGSDPRRLEDDEATTRLTPPMAVDDEPTVERPKPTLRARDDVGGATQRLVPPAVVPGPQSDTPGMDTSANAGPSIPEPFAATPASGDAGTRPRHDEAGTQPRDDDAHDGSGGQSGGAGRAGRDRTAGGLTDGDGGDLAGRDGIVGGLTGGQASGPAGGGGRAGGDGTAGGVAGGDAGAGRDGTGDGPAGDDAVSPDVVTAGDDGRVGPGGRAPGVPGKIWPFKKFVSAGVLIWVLLALFGFTLVVQLRSNNSDEGLTSARQDDLVRILSDLEARDTRLQAEITALETSQRQLTSGVAGRTAALAEAEKRADELGLLAGTLPGTGHGLDIQIDGVRASALLNAVQELRGAGGEVMQLSGAGGGAVRIVASTYFVDAEGGGIVADGKRLTGPYRLLVIGVPQTMQTALEIPGGVVASVKSGGGSVTMEQRDAVEVTALREATSLQFARPVS